MASQFNQKVANKRREKDIMKLLMSNYKVVQSPENGSEFTVQFNGPKDSLYEGGVWSVHVLLPEQYPYKSPSIGFLNKMYHPNVEENVCLDVINQAWSPMYDLVAVFDIFLPQLLNYPNPNDPFNSEAAALLMYKKDTYEKKVKDFVQKHAKGDVSDEKKQTQQKDREKKDSATLELEEDDQDDNMSNWSLSEASDLSACSGIHKDAELYY